MIEPVEVVRDEDGDFIHPKWEALIDSLGDVEIIPTNIIQLFEKAHGLNLECVTFQSTVDEDSDVMAEHISSGGSYSAWALQPPSADAVLLSIHDTEDGPVQLWAVPAHSPSYDLVEHLDRQRAFSVKAFGPGARVEGISDHIMKELAEVEAAPEDLSEWIDIVLLGLDGAWRAGYSSATIAGALAEKLA